MKVMFVSQIGERKTKGFIDIITVNGAITILVSYLKRKES